MKKLKIFILCLVAIVMTISLPSCKGDDDNTPDTPSVKKCQISKVLFDDYYLGDFIYDKEGRIISFIYFDPTSSSDDYKSLYDYSSTMITLSIDYFNRGNRYEYIRYYLKDGLIVKIIDMVNDPDQEITLEYDSNKQLVRVNNYWGRDWVLDWNNGNITKITYLNEGTVREVSTYEYTDYVNKLGLFIPDTSSEEFDDVILAAGYFGKITKNLPSKRFDSFSSSNLDSDRSYSYSGFNSEGYPTSIIFDDEDRVDLLWK